MLSLAIIIAAHAAVVGTMNALCYLVDRHCKVGG